MGVNHRGLELGTWNPSRGLLETRNKKLETPAGGWRPLRARLLSFGYSFDPQKTGPSLAPSSVNSSWIDYQLLNFLPTPTNPIKPVPRRSRVEGSGTADGVRS